MIARIGYTKRLAKYFSKLTNLDADEIVKDLRMMRIKIGLNIREYKEYIDFLTHGTAEPTMTDVLRSEIDILNKYIKIVGINSLVVQTFFKMAVSVEFTKSQIQKEYKESSSIPPAFNKALVASLNLADKRERMVDKFMREAFQFNFDNSTEEEKQQFVGTHPNYFELMRRIRKLSKRYFTKILKPKIYKLTNGSSTRIIDLYNIRDINGICYRPDNWDTDKYKNLIRKFKILNFDSDLEYIEYENPNEVGGKHEVNPDDSGKMRELYCIDPVFQVLSKAIHEWLDYIAKRLCGNGTYDQHRFIRNCIRNEWNKHGYLISTDMSKYSDTLSRYWILTMLEQIGIDPELSHEIDILYSLPVIDDLKRTIWSDTDSTYQGQYGDFPIITIMNLLCQSCVYDYSKHPMIRSDERDWNKNPVDGNSAVGDDTIMYFKEFDKDLMWIIQKCYAFLGVNINKTKTHQLINGRGFVDFLKRVITGEGLIPYIRYEAFKNDNFDEIVTELYRCYRDGMSFGEWKYMVKTILHEEDAKIIINLHMLNGGIMDRPITESDLKLFKLRNESLYSTYHTKQPDDLRRWLDNFESALLKEEKYLYHTPLVGYLNNYWYLFVEEYQYLYGLSDDDFDELIQTDEYINFMNKSSETLDKEIKDNILNTAFAGYENCILDCPNRIIGMTLSEVYKDNEMSNIALFIEDYNKTAAYRYMTSNTKKFKEHVFLDICNNYYDIDKIELGDTIVRLKQCEVTSNYEYSVNVSRFKWLCSRIHEWCVKCGWTLYKNSNWECNDGYGNYKNILYKRGDTFRRSYVVRRHVTYDHFTYSEFCEIFKHTAYKYSDDEILRYYELYTTFM